MGLSLISALVDAATLCQPAGQLSHDIRIAQRPGRKRGRRVRRVVLRRQGRKITGNPVDALHRANEARVLGQILPQDAPAQGSRKALQVLRLIGQLLQLVLELHGLIGDRRNTVDRTDDVLDQVRRINHGELGSCDLNRRRRQKGQNRNTADHHSLHDDPLPITKWLR